MKVLTDIIPAEIALIKWHKGTLQSMRDKKPDAIVRSTPTGRVKYALLYGQQVDDQSGIFAVGLRRQASRMYLLSRISTWHL